MPELPEVETVMRGIEPFVVGARIERAETYIDTLRRPLDPGFSQRLTGAYVKSLQRRAKYILITTDREDCIILHLGMSGKITFSHGINPPERIKHDHIRWLFTQKTAPEISGKTGDKTKATWITLNDARRFGMCDIIPVAEMKYHTMLSSLGPEPLDEGFTGSILSEALSGKKTPIKSALLNQNIVAGLGNIYVCEALWRAHIHPKRLAGAVSSKESHDLVDHIKIILRAAIASGGSTLRDFVRSDGSLGYFQHHFNVYDQEGKTCHRESCSGVIDRIKQANRSTYYCSVCQR